MSDAESTSTAAITNAAVAVGKGESWESVAKSALAHGLVPLVAVAGLLVQLSSNLEKTIISDVNSKIEKLSSDTKVSLVELRYGLDKKIDNLDTKSGRLMWTTTVLSLASLVSTLVVLYKK